MIDLLIGVTTSLAMIIVGMMPATFLTPVNDSCGVRLRIGRPDRFAVRNRHPHPHQHFMYIPDTADPPGRQDDGHGPYHTRRTSPQGSGTVAAVPGKDWLGDIPQVR